MGSLKMLNPTVRATAAISSKVRELPRIFSAFSRLPAPSWIEAKGAPPWPAKAAKADTSIIMGKVTPTPVSAMSPTADVDSVHNSIKQIEDLSRYRRYRQFQHQRADGGIGQAFFVTGLRQGNSLLF